MARQASFHPFTGPIGDLSFYYHKDYGYLVRQKGGPKKGIKSERTLENNREFAHASRTGKLLRLALRQGLHFRGDSTSDSRLTQLLIRILRTDPIHGRGERRVETGLQSEENKALLRAFAFSGNRAPGSVLRRSFVYSASQHACTLLHFVPQQDLVFPQAATHVRLQVMQVLISSDTDDFSVVHSSPQVFVLDDQASDAVLPFTESLNGPGLTMVLFSVTFLQEINGEAEVLAEGRIAGVV